MIMGNKNKCVGSDKTSKAARNTKPKKDVFVFLFLIAHSSIVFLLAFGGSTTAGHDALLLGGGSGLLLVVGELGLGPSLVGGGGSLLGLEHGVGAGADGGVDLLVQGFQIVGVDSLLQSRNERKFGGLRDK